MASKILERKAKEARERVAQAEEMLQTSKFSLLSRFSGNQSEDASLPESQSGRRAPHCGSGPEAADRGRPGARPPAAASGGVRARSIHEPAAGLAVRPRAVRGPGPTAPGAARWRGGGGAGCAARRRPLPRRGGGFFFAVSVSVSVFVVRPGPDAGTAAATATADASARGPPPRQLVVQWLTAGRPRGRATQGCSRGPGSWRGPGRCSCTCCT